jgi:hypothetical protein
VAARKSGEAASILLVLGDGDGKIKYNVMLVLPNLDDVELISRGHIFR